MWFIKDNNLEIGYEGVWDKVILIVDVSLKIVFNNINLSM